MDHAYKFSYWCRRPWWWWFWPWGCWHWHSCWDCGFSSDSYDHHPSPCWANFFATAPDLNAISGTRFRPEFGPVFYRGRLDGSARLLIVGQDPAADEQVARRSFVGTSGQHLQHFLSKAGITKSYVIVNTFHLSVKGSYDAELDGISNQAAVRDWRNSLFDLLKQRNSFTAILTIGTPAKDAVDWWPGSTGMTRIHIMHPSAAQFSAAQAQQVMTSWNNAHDPLKAAVAPDDASLIDDTPYGSNFGPNDHADIPRRDLPFGTPTWHGSGGGNRADRDATGKKITWTAP